MAKGLYVGVETDITSKETYNITSSNISQHFTVTHGSYKFVGTTSGVFTTNNGGVASSTASTKLTALRDCDIAFDYSYSSESSYDKFTLTVAGTTVENAVSGATTSKSYSGKLTKGQSIEFKYVKDGSQNANDDKCTFSNMVVTIQGETELKEVARRIRSAYIGVGRIARRVTKAYLGVDGVARLIYMSDVSGGYSGDYSVSIVTIGGVNYNLYTLTSSGTLTLNDTAQYWMCGGGGNGGDLGYSTAYTDDSVETVHEIGAGGGGGGGHVKSGGLTSGSYSVIIGAAGGATQIKKTGSTNSYTANAGESSSGYAGGDGGSGGGMGCCIVLSDRDGVYYRSNQGSGDGVSTYPFGLTSLLAHCAGGGGGGLCYTVLNSEYEYAYEDVTELGDSGGSNGLNGGVYARSGKGGTYGGGDGGSDYDGGGDATFYGGGGGGCFVDYIEEDSFIGEDAYYGDVGSGYQGVCYILIPR